MRRGDQFVLIPTHAADPNHVDCLHGFIASDTRMGQTVFCHFWLVPGVTVRPHGPQATDVSRLMARDSCEQEVVDKLLGAT